MLLTTLMTVQAASNKVVEELTKETEKNAKLQRQSDKENFNRLNEAIRKVNDEKTDGKLFNEILKNLGEKEKQEVTTIAKLQKTATAVGKIIDGLIAGVTQFKKATDKEAAYASDLRSSGIVIAEAGKNFADSFSGTAARLGMSSDKFLEVLKSNGSRIASLGALSAQTNLDIVKQGMSTYNKFKDLNISDARSIMEMQMDIMNNSMTSEQIRQLNLENATASLVKRFGELSLMTGKSIEQLAKEQEMKEMKSAYDAFAGMNVVADSLMRQMNFKQSWKEYVATGKITDEVAQDMAQNPELRALLTKISNDIVTGKLNNQSDIATFADRYKQDILEARDTGIAHGQYMVANRMGNAPAEFQSSLLAGAGLRVIDPEKLKQDKGSDQSRMNEILGEAGKIADAASAATDAIRSGNATALEKLYLPINAINEKRVKMYELLTGQLSPDGPFERGLVNIKNAIDKWTGGNATGISSAIINAVSTAGGTILGLGLLRKFGGKALQKSLESLSKIKLSGVVNTASKNAKDLWSIKSNVLQFKQPNIVKPLIKEGGIFGDVTKNMIKNGGKAAVETGGKTVGKSLFKKLPLGIGALIGTGFAINKLMKGEYRSAALEFASGLVSTFPGIGTAASFGIDAINAALDSDKDIQQVDQIREAGKKIVPEVEQKKEITVEPQKESENNQTEMTVSDIQPTKVSFDDKTIDNLSVVFEKAFLDALIKTFGDDIKNISKTITESKDILYAGRVSSAGQSMNGR